MKRPKKAKSQYQFLREKLRHASMSWKPKQEARNKAKVYDQIGFYKNGNPEYKVKYICAECERQGIKRLWLEEETQMDHIEPCRDPKDGDFDGDWTTYINRMFCPAEGYQCLCENHHDEKTQKEGLQRSFSKKRKK